MAIHEIWRMDYGGGGTVLKARLPLQGQDSPSSKPIKSLIKTLKLRLF